MSHWVPIGIFIASVFFFVLGGGLLGAWGASSNCLDTNYDGTYYVCSGNNGEFYAGIAMIAIGAILKFAFWIVLILWCVQRRRSRSTIVYVNNHIAAENGEHKPYVQTNVQTEYTGVQGAPHY